MIPEALGNALLLFAFTFGGMIVARALRLELTLACLLTGLVAGQLLAPLGLDTGVRAHNVDDLVFFLLLPPLLFQAAWHLQVATLRRWAVPITLLSTLGVGIGALVTAALLFFTIDHPGFPWVAALLAGAMLAAIDPVAVVTRLHAARASEDVTTLIEGESLLNDATAAILFGVVFAMALGAQEAPSAFSVGELVLRHLVLAPIFGCALAFGTFIAIRYLDSTSATQGLLLFSAFLSFFLAEEILHVSGIIAVVVTGLTLRTFFSRAGAPPPAAIAVTWDWVGQTWTALTYVLLGLVVVPGMFLDQWFAALVAIPIALFSRAVAVFAALSPPGSAEVSLPWRALLVWGGLRGAIAIALVLALPTELPYWYTLQAMVFSVVLFSSLVQGTTTGPLLRRLGLAAQSRR